MWLFDKVEHRTESLYRQIYYLYYDLDVYFSFAMLSDEYMRIELLHVSTTIEICIKCILILIIIFNNNNRNFILNGRIRNNDSLVYTHLVTCVPKYQKREMQFPLFVCRQLCTFSWVLSLLGRYFYNMYIVKMFKIVFFFTV